MILPTVGILAVQRVDFEKWKLYQVQRISEMNQMLVETIRKTSGGNTARFLSLLTADYGNHEYLKNLTLPNDSCLMVQLHSYSKMEDNINLSAGRSSADKVLTLKVPLPDDSPWNCWSDTPIHIIGNLNVTEQAVPKILKLCQAAQFR